jgi:hypothetical protein
MVEQRRHHMFMSCLCHSNIDVLQVTLRSPTWRLTQTVVSQLQCSVVKIAYHLIDDVLDRALARGEEYNWQLLMPSISRPSSVAAPSPSSTPPPAPAPRAQAPHAPQQQLKYSHEPRMGPGHRLLNYRNQDTGRFPYYFVPSFEPGVGGLHKDWYVQCNYFMRLWSLPKQIGMPCSCSYINRGRLCPRFVGCQPLTKVTGSLV